MDAQSSSEAHTHTPDQTRNERNERFGRLRRLVRDDGRRQRLLFLASLVALAVVCVLAGLARLLTVLPLDVWFTRELQEHPRAFITQAMVVVSSFGYMPWLAVTLVGATLLVGVLLGWKDGAYLLLITALQAIVNAGVKLVIGRPRPLDTLVDVFVPVHGNSFPSGHVMFYTVFFGFLFFLAWSRAPRSPLRVVALVICAGLVVLIGPSRIVLGAHWLSDVIAAYLLGLILLAFAIEFYLRYLAPQNHTQQGGLVQAHDR
ncbi:MAG: phosphatase PAP2 family protein [Chloroflexales bacterium]|nr:phosphatase PAP2 family protein [Chloroflexales bacterium]